ncbi:hypothetical protein C8J57DRAFT_1340940 [Mycena rebaudengoi]|nr:hypothetical protein C8J57DRAFT_1340940 [Mycena rebaudengoi]
MDDDAAATKLWTVYVSEAEKYDKALVESWRSDMNAMLIFAGLFSAILTAFLIESYQTLLPGPGDDTAFFLRQISGQLAASASGTNFTVSQPVPHVPTMTSLVCNILWFISLGLSLACALIATLLEQWAREFIHRSEMHSAPLIHAHCRGGHSSASAHLPHPLLRRPRRISRPRQHQRNGGGRCAARHCHRNIFGPHPPPIEIS